MKTILKPLAEVNDKTEFLVGTKLLKIVVGLAYTYYEEYALVRANWCTDYMMLIRKIDKNSNRAEYGIIPETLKSGKIVINKNSFKRTLGKKLANWLLLIEK